VQTLMTNYTKNFSDEELTCKCGCGTMLCREEQQRLQIVRDCFGGPIYVARTISCPTHNKAIGGADGSAHLDKPDEDASGVDVGVKTFPTASHRAKLIRCALEAGYNCFGVGNTRFHMDARKLFWNLEGIRLLWAY